MTDLAAIEARHYCPGKGGEFGDEGYCVACCQPWPCDAKVLLDELRDAVARLRESVPWSAYLKDLDQQRDASVAGERERIAEAVRGLPAQRYQLGLDWAEDSRMVNRAAVLAIVDKR